MNMSPEYRREYRHLNKIRAKLVRDHKRMVADVERQKKQLDRQLLKGKRATEREVARIARRMVILGGRLS